jgi:glycosyltransferase involved in cell wall biosynthesis
MSKLRVLLAIDDASLGGGQMHVLLLAKYLSKDNLEVEIATEGKGWLVDEAKKLDITVHQIAISNNLTWQSFDRIRQLLDSQRFDILHTHGGTAGFWIRLVAIGLSKRPILIHTYHGIHYLNISQTSIKATYQKFKRAIFKQIDRFLMNYTDRIICVCRSDYDKAIAVKVATSDRTSIIYNGIEIDRFTQAPSLEDRDNIRQLFGIQSPKFIFGNVGRLHIQKGHKFLLQAFINVDNCAHLVIVGDGELRDELIELAAKLHIRDRVLFLGEQADIAEFLSAIDVFVLPSLWEGQPIALLEALASSKPCIVSNVDGMPEIIETGINGYLVTPRAVQELTKIMNLAISDPEKLQKFSTCGLSTSFPKFSAQNMATEIATIYMMMFST